MEFQKQNRNLTNLAGAGLSGSQDLVTNDTVSLAPEKNQRRKKYWNNKTSKQDSPPIYHTDPICQIFSKNSFNGKIASKLFKFEWFGIFKTSDG